MVDKLAYPNSRLWHARVTLQSPSLKPPSRPPQAATDEAPRHGARGGPTCTHQALHPVGWGNGARAPAHAVQAWVAPFAGERPRLTDQSCAGRNIPPDSAGILDRPPNVLALPPWNVSLWGRRVCSGAGRQDFLCRQAARCCHVQISCPPASCCSQPPAPREEPGSSSVHVQGRTRHAPTPGLHTCPYRRGAYKTTVPCCVVPLHRSVRCS